jgi:hypothetical protein
MCRNISIRLVHILQQIVETVRIWLPRLIRDITAVYRTIKVFPGPEETWAALSSNFPSALIVAYGSAPFINLNFSYRFRLS